MHKFHFNQRFRKNQLKSLLDDFLSEPTVLHKLAASFSDASTVKGDAKWENLTTNIVSLDFFDRLEESGVVGGSGLIKRMYDEIYDGVTCENHLRDMLLNPESEYADLFSEEDREEFIYHIFKWVSVGGSMSQPDEVISPYIKITKALYR